MNAGLLIIAVLNRYRYPPGSWNSHSPWSSSFDGPRINSTPRIYRPVGMSIDGLWP